MSNKNNNYSTAQQPQQTPFAQLIAGPEGASDLRFLGGPSEPNTQDGHETYFQKQLPISGPFMSSLHSPIPSQSRTPDEDFYEFGDEIPLLEELGIRPEHIVKRMKSVLFFHKLDHDLLVDSDMSGPLFVAMSLGFCLLLSGKLHFGYIYGLGIVGCLGSYVLLNLMSSKDSIDLYRTMSILGYSLIPVVLLAFVSIFLPLRTTYGSVFSVLCILWCTATASRFFETVGAICCLFH
uniref:Protein YIPF n=3 Tax=Lankesteria abbotti TaxID=340204 RepID=A0A7S2QRL5_9APIC|mmetsp:Transcript_573/g.638  ORF Transcript_573/g.638 Transcript_573/m.638 type:complete len:236 (+) Transcript_573:31-738(+)